MTGELCDIFADRSQGVRELAAILTRLVGHRRTIFYAGRTGFVRDDEVAGHAMEIASANWHASASFSAARLPAALFIDVGSTTADLIPLAEGHPANIGFTDAERLAHGELVYTGLSRSCLSGGPKLVPFAGRWTAIMNECFATMADVHRILGQLPDDADMMETADGRDKTIAASCARLARMIGRDGAEADVSAWRHLAGFFAEAQLHDLLEASALVLSRGLVPEDAPIIGCGVGRGIVRELAARLHRSYRDFGELIDVTPAARAKACDCAAATAAALLAASQFAA